MSRSVSRSSKRSSRLTEQASGGEYQFTLYIDLHMDDANEEPEEKKVKCSELGRFNPWSCFQDNEPILNIFIYKKPLSSKQLTMAIFYHLFVIFETKNYWWSIEKNDQGVTIQRSTRFKDVCDFYRRERRERVRGKPFEYIARDRACGKTLGELVEYLNESRLVATPYSLLSNNCQHFAKRVFNNFSHQEWIY